MSEASITKRHDAGTTSYEALQIELEGPGLAHEIIPLTGQYLRHRMLVGPSTNVCYRGDELTQLLERSEQAGKADSVSVVGAGIVAKCTAVIPVENHDASMNSLGTPELRDMIGAGAACQSQPLFVADGFWNPSAVAGMMRDPTNITEADPSRSDTMRLILEKLGQSSLVVGTATFFSPQAIGEGLTIPIPVQESSSEVKVNLTAIVYDAATGNLSARPINRHTVNTVSEGELSLVGWLGIGSDGGISVYGRDSLLEEEPAETLLPCLMIEAMTVPDARAYPLDPLAAKRLQAILARASQRVVDQVSKPSLDARTPTPDPAAASSPTPDVEPSLAADPKVTHDGKDTESNDTEMADTFDLDAFVSSFRHRPSIYNRAAGQRPSRRGFRDR